MVGPGLPGPAVDLARQLAGRYRPHGVITMVDGVNAAEQLADFAEPVKQVAIADRLLVSKPDLAPPAALDRLETRLRVLNPGAPIVRVVTTEVDAITALGSVWQPEAEGHVTHAVHGRRVIFRP